LQAALALVVPRAITPTNTKESISFLRNFMKFPPFLLV